MLKVNVQNPSLIAANLIESSQWCRQVAGGFTQRRALEPSALAQAAADRRDGADPRAVIRTLESDEGDPLAAALARLGRTLESRNPQ